MMFAGMLTGVNMSIHNLYFKEVKPKDMKHEMVHGIGHLSNSECNASLLSDCQIGSKKRTYVVTDYNIYNANTWKSGKGRWKFTNVNEALKKFKELCGIK